MNEKLLNETSTIEYSIDNAEFLKRFYKVVKILAEDAFHFSNKNYTASQEFDDDEKMTLLAMNNVIFENIYSFFHLIEKHLLQSSICCLRSAMEVSRLFSLFVLDGHFRYSYIHNPNYSFRETRDSDFLQGKVSKKLKSFFESHANASLPLFTDSMFSEIHSEMSKIVHMTNINLVKPMYFNKDKCTGNYGIYLGIGLEYYNDFVQQFYIKKYIEATFHLLINNLALCNNLADLKNESRNDMNEILDMYYDVYIKLIY